MYVNPFAEDPVYDVETKVFIAKIASIFFSVLFVWSCFLLLANRCI